MCTLYKITNTLNDKVYIGQTWETDLLKYFKKSHVHVKGRTKLYRAIQKHGADNFMIEPLLVVEHQSDADKMECVLIEKYDSINNGYNLRSGGAHGKHSKESKRKISESQKGRPKHSEESKKRIAASRLGRKLPLSTKHKMSKAKLGKHMSPGTEFKKGHTQNRMFSPSKEGQILASYDELRSSYKVSKMYGCSHVTVLNIVNRSKSIKNNHLAGNKNELNKESDK